MKSTSIKSYYELVESGELSKKQIEVANCFRRNGHMTGRQVSRLIPGAWKRIKELQDCGILTDAGTMYDYETKKHVHFYRWSGDQPLLPLNKEPKRSQYEQGIRDTLSFLYYGFIPENLFEEILELRKGLTTKK